MGIMLYFINVAVDLSQIQINETLSIVLSILRYRPRACVCLAQDEAEKPGCPFSGGYTFRAYRNHRKMVNVFDLYCRHVCCTTVLFVLIIVVLPGHASEYRQNRQIEMPPELIPNKANSHQNDMTRRYSNPDTDPDITP